MNSHHKFSDNLGADLEEWEKNKNTAFMDKVMILKKITPHNSSPRHR